MTTSPTPELLYALVLDAREDPLAGAADVLADGLDERNLHRAAIDLRRALRALRAAEKGAREYYATPRWFEFAERHKRADQRVVAALRAAERAVKTLEHPPTRPVWWWTDTAGVLAGREGDEARQYPVEIASRRGRASATVRILASRYAGRVVVVHPDELTRSPRAGVRVAPGAAAWRRS